MFVAVSWDRREDNLKKRGHLLTAAELKRRGITRYDAEMLLSQGFSLPEPKTSVGSPADKKRRAKSSTPVRFSPRSWNKLPLSGAGRSQAATPTSTGDLPKSVAKRSVVIGRSRNRRVDRSLRSRVASRQLEFRGGRRLRPSSGAGIGVTTRHVAKQTAKDTDADRPDFGDDEAEDSGPESSSAGSSAGHAGRNVGVDVALSMSCDAIDTDSSPWNPWKVAHFDGAGCSDIVRPHCSTAYTDAAYYYKRSIFICLSVYYNHEPCQNC